MNAVHDIEISNLSRADKVKLLQILVRDLSDEFEGFEKTVGVCGGSARIENTRIPVWVLENARRLGISESDLLLDYPTISAQDLVNAWNYVRAHRSEIESEIQRNEEA